VFQSGDADLDRYFQRFAGQNQFRHHVGVTYVAANDTGILGFATVAPAEISVEILSARDRKQLPAFPLPALRLARLAVDREAQGNGIGLALLRFTLTLALKMRDELGCVGVIVDAKPNAVAFYERLGFLAVAAESGHLADRPQPTLMFLPIASIT
jgi:GNAT superfamily N-acetyltransferase